MYQSKEPVKPKLQRKFRDTDKDKSKEKKKDFTDQRNQKRNELT